MRYYYTRLLSLGLGLIFAIVFVAPAQTTTDSPYSRYGSGLKVTPRFNGNFGLGGSGIAWRPISYRPLINDSLAKSNRKLRDRTTNYLNPANPASYSNLSLTVFEASFVSNNTSMLSGGQEFQTNNTYFNHLSMGFPIADWWGAGFGITPFSQVGYDYQNAANNDPYGQVEYSYEGSGGLNRFFINNAFTLGNNFSLGIGTSFIFGNLKDQRRVEFLDLTNVFNTLDVNETSVGDIYLESGLQYFTDISENYRLNLGLIASFNNQLGAKRSQIIRNYSGSAGIEAFRDTLLFADENNVEIDIPLKYGLGIAFEKRNRWITMVDYVLYQWQDPSGSDADLLTDNNEIRFGFEKLSDFDAFRSFWKRAAYRFGARYSSSILRLNGQDVQEYGISFGLALPLRNSFSTVNFGAEVGRRGEDNNDLIEETFFNLQIGVTINDKWFIKRKYD